MNDIDRLKTLARVLLSALEENQEFLAELGTRPYTEELKEDNEAVISEAHKVLVDFPA